MEPEIPADRLAMLEEKIDKIYKSVEKTRKYFFWTMVISIVVVVLPAIGLVFVIPFFLNSYVGGIQSLMQ
jgi:type IV secretory pathway component VirB8